MDHGKTSWARELRDAALLALAAAAVAACLRAVFWGNSRGLFEGGLDIDGVETLRLLARAATSELALVAFFFTGLSLAAVALRRGRHGVLFAAPVAAFYAFFTWGFVTLRMPEELWTHTALDSTRGLLGNGLAAAVGIALASLVLLALFVPKTVAGPARGLRWLGLTLLVVVLGLRAAGLLLVKTAARPNVLLISIDTLRADHLASYGYGRETAPNIRAFAASALRFELAFSNHPWTLTAHATMLTGLLPSAHGVGRTTGLDPRVPTLAGLMKDGGYRTFGVVDANEWLNSRYGYARGFERYRQLKGDGDRKVEELLDCIDDARVLGGPFFGFAHFYDVHSDWNKLPYDSEPIDQQRFAGWYEGDFDGCNADLGCASELLVAMNARGEALEGDDLRYMQDLYDAGIASLDRRLGKLFDGLAARGLFENTVVILTSDHGEEFFEHGQALHGQHFDECLHVPLFICAPGGQRGASTDELAGLVDLMPTVLDFAGLANGAFDHLQGRSLAPLLLGEGITDSHPILMDTGSGIFGLRTPRYSVIRAPGTWRLFDTLADPGEKNNLYGTEALSERELESLRAALRKRRDATLALGARFSEHVPLEDPTEEATASLAKLGYAEGEAVEDATSEDL